MDKTSRHKMVILVTDGEDLENSGVTAARRLATNKVVIFTVGVGTPAGKEVQIVNAAGQTELLRNAQGEIVLSRLDEKTLRTIAQVTGGSYYPLGPLGDGLMHDGFAGHSLQTQGKLASIFRCGCLWHLPVQPCL